MGKIRPSSIPSRKAPADRRSDDPVHASKSRPAVARQEGTLWQRKMRTLATKRSENQRRRDRSGAPMKRG